MQLVQIPKENIEEVWPIVVKDIADALARSNGYALADHIKKWILEEKMQYGFFGVSKINNIMEQ